MPSASPLKTLLAQQRESLDVVQPIVKPHQYLASVSPLFNENSPVRTRMGSGGGSRKILSPSEIKAGAISSPEAPVQQIQQQQAASSPAKQHSGGVPAAKDAYMQELPLAPYGSTAHLNLHITETLQLALRILQKNDQLGKALSDRDRELVAEIARFAAPPPPPAAVAANEEPETAASEVPEATVDAL
jgi:hypothetical protein